MEPPRKSAIPTVLDYLYNCTVLDIKQVRLCYQNQDPKKRPIQINNHLLGRFPRIILGPKGQINESRFFKGVLHGF